MSHQRYPSHDLIKEPHAISLKVLRLSRPSLVFQYPIPPPGTSPSSHPAPIPASLAYAPPSNASGAPSGHGADPNPEPFVLTPIVALPQSFGSAYVGETFSCTLCANHDLPDGDSGDGAGDAPRKPIRDVRIEAEIKTPGTGAPVQKLELKSSAQPYTLKPPGGKQPPPPPTTPSTTTAGVDLEPGSTLQRMVDFDLKEEGNHVLVVTVSYYEATETSGRTRTFRKLYQFICKSSLIVRTKATPLHPNQDPSGNTPHLRRWALEAQLENCSEDAIRLERVGLDLEPGLLSRSCNWDASSLASAAPPVLHPAEVEQVCFVVEEEAPGSAGPALSSDGRVTFGVLAIAWRGEMGSRGFLSTGKLGGRAVR